MPFGSMSVAAPGLTRPLLSICIPAYNRASLLAPLLASVVEQGHDDCEIVIAEDCSPQRADIVTVVDRFRAATGLSIRLELNATNLGYDGNIRRLVDLATGRYCFFMGNDDLLAPGALAVAAACLKRHPGVGMLLRGYAWFDARPDKVSDTVRYVDRETLFPAGAEALQMCFRRSGIISGYVIDRDAAAAAHTDRYDGSLYYQMHLTASVLQNQSAVATPEVLVLCRNSEAPEFGAAAAEQADYQPGRYTPHARVTMVAGALNILRSHEPEIGRQAYTAILRDYARHFYPFLRDQLDLRPADYVRLCRSYAKLDIGRFPSFYVNCTVAYLLGRRLTDSLIHAARRGLGHTPRLS